MTDNLPIRIYVSEIESIITFRKKIGYYLEVLMPLVMKLLRGKKSKITKDENSQNVPHLDSTESNIQNGGIRTFCTLELILIWRY